MVMEGVRQSAAGRAVRVKVLVPGEYEAECSGVLTDEKGTIVLDTPCTEALAKAYLETKRIPGIKVDFSAFAFYLDGRKFWYEGHPFPQEFRVSKRGFSVFKAAMPPDFYKTLKGLKPLPLNDAYFSSLFAQLPAPSAKDLTRNMKKMEYEEFHGEAAAFQTFLDMLNADLRNYAAKMGTHVWLTPAHVSPGSLTNRYEGIALILNARGKTVAHPLASSIDFRQLVEEENGEAQVSMNLKKLGCYQRPQGVPFFFKGKVSRIRASQKYPGAVVFTIPFTSGSEVRKALQNNPVFHTHQVGTWWMEDFYPRVERAVRHVERM